MLARLLALALLAYFLPGERVVDTLAGARAKQPPLHVEATLAVPSGDAPARLAFDLHPELGLRAEDDRGRRWLLQGGRAVAGSALPPPAWLPDLEVLVLRSPETLRAWLAAHGIDPAANELAPCADGDCYVLGTRQGAAQLWVEKSALEVRRVIVPSPAMLVLSNWRAFDKLRFPARLELTLEGEPVASIDVVSVTAAPGLTPGDFAPAWVQAAPGRPE